MQLKSLLGNFLVVGGSRGIGAAVSEHLSSYTNQLITVSRSPAYFGNWIKADVTTKEGIESVKNAVGDSILDGLLYMGD
jgi:3-oxoacyl-[acyl-carrier protein] reductase